MGIMVISCMSTNLESKSYSMMTAHAGHDVSLKLELHDARISPLFRQIVLLQRRFYVTHAMEIS